MYYLVLKIKMVMIKKIVLGLMAMVCLTACDEDYTDWSAPQSSPQEDA